MEATLLFQTQAGSCWGLSGPDIWSLAPFHCWWERLMTCGEPQSQAQTEPRLPEPGQRSEATSRPEQRPNPPVS